MSHVGGTVVRGTIRHLPNRTEGSGKPNLSARQTIFGDAGRTRARCGIGERRAVAGIARNRRVSGAAPGTARRAALKEAGR